MRIFRSAAMPVIAAATLPLAVIAAAQDRGAPQFTDLADIDRQVAGFTGAQAGGLGGAKGRVDRRLRLARCFSPLAITWHGIRRDTVRVECPDSEGWRIFVATTGGSSAAVSARANPVQQQAAIKRGEQVNVTVRGRGFSVSRSGEAMEEGVVGDWIKVRPSDSREAIRGRVVRPGLVEIPIG